MNRSLVLFVLIGCILLVQSASILDYLTGDLEGRDESDTNKNCICNGPSCICCLDFNISLIDLGGPGCVRMNYLSPEEGIAINVSYGDSIVHSSLMKGPDPEPACLNIFAQLAQMCARFKELLPTDDGLRGCVNLEPMLLGEVQIELPVGCFRMSPKGMQIIQSSSELIKEQQPNEPEENINDSENTGNSTGSDTEIIPGYKAEDILEAVNQSAEEGISLLSSWLGLTANSNETVEENSNEPDNDSARNRKS